MSSIFNLAMTDVSLGPLAPGVAPFLRFTSEGGTFFWPSVEKKKLVLARPSVARRAGTPAHAATRVELFSGREKVLFLTEITKM